MQTLKLSVSLPDETHPDMELRFSANDSSCDVVIALPLHPRSEATNVVAPRAAAQSVDNANAPGTSASTDSLPGTSADDDYVLGGYAGI